MAPLPSHRHTERVCVYIEGGGARSRLAPSRFKARKAKLLALPVCPPYPRLCHSPTAPRSPLTEPGKGCSQPPLSSGPAGGAPRLLPGGLPWPLGVASRSRLAPLSSQPRRLPPPPPPPFCVSGSRPLPAGRALSRPRVPAPPAARALASQPAAPTRILLAPRSFPPRPREGLRAGQGQAAAGRGASASPGRERGGATPPGRRRPARPGSARLGSGHKGAEGARLPDLGFFSSPEFPSGARC